MIFRAWTCLALCLLGLSFTLAADPPKAPNTKPKPSAKLPPPPPPTLRSFQTALYQVDLSADGNLRNLRLRGADGQPAGELLTATSFLREDFLRSKKFVLKPPIITPLDNRRMEALIGIEGTEMQPADPEAFRFTYQFDDMEINVELKVRPGISFGLILPEVAQLAQNLNTGREMALPPLKGASTGGPLQSMRVTYSHGAELLFRWTGPGNPLNVNENGSFPLKSYQWGMRGATPNATYQLVFRPVRPEQPRTVLASPQFQFRNDVPGNIFFDAEPRAVGIYLERDELERIRKGLGDRQLQGVQVAYRVTDHHDREVETGAVPIDLNAEPAKDGSISQQFMLQPSPHGYYEVHVRIEDSDGAFRPVWKSLPFSVVEAIDSPEAERAAMLAAGTFDEWSRDAFIGLGLNRRIVDERITPEAGKVNFTPLVDKAFDEARARSQATGVNYHFMLFSGGGITWARTPQDLMGIYEQILARYKDRNQWWETLNEPNITYRPQEYIDMYLKPLKLAAEKVDPQAKIIGGSICGFGPEFLDEIYKLGAKEYMDAVSLHPYIGIPYDVQFVPAIERTRAIMARYGDQEKPVWFTECGFGWSNLATQVRAARNNVRRLLIQEQYGIPPEHDMYYFTTEMGYYNFYVMQRDGTLLPQAVALRARKVRTEGAKYEGPLAFGVPYVRGNVNRGPKSTVLALWTYDSTRPVQVKTDATTVAAWDMWGNPIDVVSKDGVLSVTASGEPVYVALPGEAQVEAVPVSPGRNLADLAFGAEATASSEAQPADLALDGTTFGGGWQDATPGRFPDSLEVAIPLAAASDRVRIFMSESASGGCVRDMDVLGQVDGKLIKLVEVRDNTDALLEVSFPATAVQKVRLDVLAGNDPTITIYELQVLAANQAQTTGELVNWAAAENGATALASSTNSKHEGDFLPAGAIDGKSTAAQWKDYTRTVWIDDTAGEFPDWLQVDLAGKHKLSAVLVFTNNFARFKPRDTGISDADLEAWDGQQWRVVGSVAGSKKGVLTFPLNPPLETDKLRLVIKDSNDHYKSAVMELQALGPRQ